MCKQRVQASIRENVSFVLQFWPVLVTVVTGVIYLSTQQAILKTEVANLKNSVDRIERNLDRRNVMYRGGNHAWKFDRTSNDAEKLRD